MHAKLSDNLKLNFMVPLNISYLHLYFNLYIIHNSCHNIAIDFLDAFTPKIYGQAVVNVCVVLILSLKME